MKRCVLPIAILLALCTLNTAAWGLMLSSFGNSPVSPLNYQDWPGIIPVLEDSHRVYSVWVNGNERFFYRGDTSALNETLEAFAAIEAPVHEMVLRPGPAIAGAIDGKEVPHDWVLHIMGGRSEDFYRAEKDTQVFDKYPTLTVFVGENIIDLEDIEVPKDVTVLELGDLRARYLAGLKSSNDEVRGYAAMYLADVDPYHVENVAPIAALLDDADTWVRLMAIGALQRFGEPARAMLVKAAERSYLEDRERESLTSALEHIDQMKTDTDSLKAHQALLALISAFRKTP